MFSHENNNVKRCKTDGHNQRNPDMYGQNITGQKTSDTVFISGFIGSVRDTLTREQTEHSAPEGHGQHAAQHVAVPVTFPVLNHTTHNVRNTQRDERLLLVTE